MEAAWQHLIGIRVTQEFWDDLSDKKLDAKSVKEAREEEMQ